MFQRGLCHDYVLLRSASRSFLPSLPAWPSRDPISLTINTCLLNPYPAGAALPYFTTHHELVRLQKEAVEKKKAARVGLARDDDWSGDGFVAEAESMVAQ